MEDTEVKKPAGAEVEIIAARRARDRANVARWDLDVAVFLFAILIIVMILLFQGIGIEIVGPIAIFGLAMVWLVGWRRGNQLYKRFYEEEREMLAESMAAREKKASAKLEETVEEQVQRALRDRLR